MPKKKERRTVYIVRIGPELMELLKEQVEKIKEVTYGIANESIWEAGEIVAKKYKGEV